MTPRESVSAQVASCRRAQAAWAERPIGERLRVVRALRHSLVDAADELTAAIHRELGRPPHEALASDVLPFADACRFLEREAERLLRPRKVSLRSRPIWLWGQRDTIYRRPHGVVNPQLFVSRPLVDTNVRSNCANADVAASKRTLKTNFRMSGSPSS